MGNSHDEAIPQAYDAYDDLMLDKRYIRDNDAWGDLRIDRENGAISLLLRWKYNWIKRWDAKADWTDMEKNAFHGKVIFVIAGTGESRCTQSSMILYPVFHFKIKTWNRIYLLCSN